MDLPLMDLEALFALDPVDLETSLADPMATTAAVDSSGLNERLAAPHQNASQRSGVDTISKLGACSNCRRYDLASSYTTTTVTNGCAFRKKRRCNLERPACSLCHINGWTCEYLHVKKRPGPPRGSASRQTLSSRLELVEALVASRAEAAQATRPVDAHDKVACNSWDTLMPKVTSTEGPTTRVAEVASVIPTNTPAVLNSVTLGQVLDLSENTKAILISLYFDNVQPIFPLFRRGAFQADLRDNRVPEPLLNLMFALASRYVLPSEMLQTFGQNVVEPWEHFARVGFKKSRFNEENDSNAPMSLEDVKTSFLLTLHEYTSFPGRKAWMRVGNTVRAAIAAGLHRIDEPNHCSMSSMSEAEMEEWRFTWWAVWRVDSSINILASSPFNIETRDIHTALPSTSAASFTRGVITPCSADFLPADAIKPWKSAQDLQRTLSKHSPNFYFQVVSYNREAMICRRRLYLNPTLELTSKFNDFKQIFPYLRVALPQPFLSGARQPTRETIDGHRQRIETLILLHITEVGLYLPIREQGFYNANHVQQKRLVDDWQICIDNIEEMAALLRHWEPHYSKLTDPMISCVIWISSSILVLHTMSTSYQNAQRCGHGVAIQDSLELLSAALEGFSLYWPIASLLLESLQSLRSWNWLSLGFQDILFVASQLHAPINPEAQNPATINIWPLFPNPQQEPLRDPMSLK
ncbi:hypothetical protein V500_00809 [Pseudogymnoascus sp. VKM F-4518 (FW-2643)]|nr:hypothetical protein V500_00809 [Pseudogymnoascus sp. VKM F-4518 (FW-2643)]